MTTKPQTKGNEILAQINVMLDLGKFINPNDPRIIALVADIGLLHSANRDEALWMQALLFHLTGDLPAALTSLNKCEVYDPINHLVLVSNYLRCKQAQEIFSKCCGPRGGLFTSSAFLSFVSGAFHQAAEFARAAQALKLTNLDTIPMEKIFMIDQMLTEFGVSDTDAGEVMETAGEVITEHGLMFLGPGPEIDVFDIPGELRSIHLTYRLAVTASKAVDMYLDFIERLVKKDQLLPRGLHISFGGAEA